jgi:hypothetical protein
MAQSYMYGKAILAVLNKEVDWAADTIKVMLCTSSYVANQDTHDYKDDVTNEISDASYTAGGKALSSATIAYDAGTNIIKLDAADLTWTALTAPEVRYAVVYDDTPATDATKPLLGFIDFDENLACAAADLVITWSADGIFEIAVA